MDRRLRLGGLWVAVTVALVFANGAVCRGDAAPESTPFDPLAGVVAELGRPVSITAAIEPGAGGQPDVLAVTATLDDGWHLYSITQRPGGPRATVIELAADSPRRTAGLFAPDAEPTRHTVDDVPAWKGLVLEEHAGRVTWRAPLEPGTGEVRGTVMLQLCQDSACTPPDTIAFTASAVARAADRPGPLAAATVHRPERTHAEVRVALRSAAGGRRLVIDVVPDEGWHVYKPSASGTSGIGQGKPTIVASGSGEAARVIRATAAAARVAANEELARAGAVEGPVAFDLEVEEAKPIDIVIGVQTCSDTTCDPPTGVRISQSRDGGDMTFSAARYADAARAPLALTAAAGPAPVVTATPVAGTPAGTSAPLTLPLALLSGLLGGLILNLMPCVLPVLGLKLLSFAQQSGRARREVFEMNLWYCAGVYAVFFALATASVAANIGLAGTNLGWGQQFQFVSFRIAMLGIVFAFALSFLGVWEIPIPGFIGEQAGHVQTKEGPLGSFLKGVLGTVLATPCSGPFLGPVFGFTLGQPTAVSYAVFGSIATGMALPYILVGLFPGLVRFLPRPGPWMATFKELLGFVMLGTVAYLFFMLRQQPVWFVPTFVMLIGIWMGCWWVGRQQERVGAVGFGRWVQALALATAVGMTGFFWLGPHVGPGGRPLIEWEQPFSVRQLATHRDGGATVLVDFTADWCPTCKTNLATAIETKKVSEAIRRNRVVPILADFTDRSPEIDRFLASMGSRSIPFLVIFPGGKPGDSPREPIVLRDAITESQLLAALEQAGPSCCPPPEIRAASAGTAPAGR